MKVEVDYDVCEGHGECVIAAPEVFDLDDAGQKVVLLQEEPHENLRAKVTDAVRRCPVSALRLEG